MEVGIASAYPSLIAVGEAPVDRYDEEDVPEAIQGHAQFLKTELFPSGRLVRHIHTHTHISSAVPARMLLFPSMWVRM